MCKIGTISGLGKFRMDSKVGDHLWGFIGQKYDSL